MGWQIFENIALYVAANHAHVFLAFDLEVEQSRQKAALFQTLEQDVERNIDRQRIAAATINDTRNQAIAPCLTSGALACPRAFLGVKVRNFSSHN